MFENAVNLKEGYFSYYKSNFNFGYLPKSVETLRVSFSNLTSLENISNLNNLINLDINNNNLTSLYDLKELSKLETLNLNNNLLQNYFTYKDDSGNHTVNTCEFLATLPNLKKIYLAGNSDLTDFSGLINVGFKQSGTTFTKE